MTNKYNIKNVFKTIKASRKFKTKLNGGRRRTNQYLK